MPTIQRLKPRERKDCQRNENTDERVLRKQLYNTTKWRKAREYHIRTQPLCQECLKEGKVYGGTLEDPIQVHHIRSPFQDGKINWDMALDDNNLETICSYHHGLIHQKEKGYRDPQEILDALEELFNDIDNGSVEGDQQGL